MSESRRAFIDNITGVLKAHGYLVEIPEGTTVIEVSEDFNLTPGQFRWNGSAWESFTLPSTQSELDVLDFYMKIDSVLADGTVPTKIKGVFSALKKIIR